MRISPANLPACWVFLAGKKRVGYDTKMFQSEPDLFCALLAQQGVGFGSGRILGGRVFAV